MSKHFYIPFCGALILLSCFLTAEICLKIQAEEIPGETNPAFAWELPAPSGFSGDAHSQNVVYRPVHEIVYAASPLYVRSGPGSNFPLIGRLSAGEVVRRGAIGNNGWSQILFEDREAYVNSTYLSVSPMVPLDGFPETSFQKTDDRLRASILTKLRSGPGPDYAVVGQLNRGDGIRRAAVGENGWSRIIFHDTEVYACTAALESPSADTVFSELDEKQQVYAAADSVFWDEPHFSASVLGKVSRGTSLIRTAVSAAGWSRIACSGQDLYLPTAYLTLEPAPEAPLIATQAPERPTENSPFLFQYIAPDTVMPFALFRPVDAEPGKPLPLILSLHGALEIGEAPETLKANFITKEIRNWEYTGFRGFDAYVVCPQMTGLGLADTWNCRKSADNLFALIDYLKETYPIDESKIILEGHSLGGQGALYMAADPRACFSAVVPISAYDPNISCAGILAKVRGYTGSPYIPAPREDWVSFHFMEEIFGALFGSENWHIMNCSHYDIPMVAFEEDLDGNGQSDLIEWMLAQ